MLQVEFPGSTAASASTSISAPVILADPHSPAENLLIVDPVTGAAVGKISAERTGPKRKRYYFPGGFCYMGLVYVSKLARLKMPADAYRLALLIMESTGYAGVCSRRHDYFGQILGVDRPRVSRLITILEREEVVRRLGGSSLLVSPTFYHRGTPEEQLAALDHWRSLVGPEVVFDLEIPQES